MMGTTQSIVLGILCSAAFANAFAPLGRISASRKQIPLQSKQTSAGDVEAEIDRRVALVQAAALASGLFPSTQASALSLLSLEGQVTALERQNVSTKNTQGAPEKHLPIVTLTMKSIEVKVPHVMNAEKPHYIQFIWLQDLTNEKATTKNIVAVQALRPTDVSPPTLTAGIASGRLRTLVTPITQGMVVKPLVYCNLHGLWEGEPITIKTV